MTTFLPRPDTRPELGPEPASPIEPPPRARLAGLFDELISLRGLPPPGLPQGVPDCRAQSLTSPPSLLLVGEVLSDAGSGNLRHRGFRKVVDVEDLVDALGALSERRYDAVAIWDHVHEKPVRFVRALLGFQGRAEDPLLPLLTSRVKNVPVAILHNGGGFAVFLSDGRWCLSESGGPDWTDALMSMIPDRGV